jgi:hypothetical protein
MPQLISEHYEYNMSRMTIFQKPTVRKHFYAYIRTTMVLTGGKLTRFYFLQLTIL